MEYGNALPPSFVLPKGLFFLTKGDFKNNPFVHVIVRPGDRVMDVGAAVGGFSVAALEQGAKSVRCYEPIAKTFEILRDNVAPYGKRAVAIEAAMIAGEEPTLIMSSRPLGLNSPLPRPQDKTITVPARCFRTELAAFHPHVLKLDIEGGEYAILDDLRPGELKSVRSLFIEFHPLTQQRPCPERPTHVAVIREFLEAEGFTVVSDRLRAFTLVRK